MRKGLKSKYSNLIKKIPRKKKKNMNADREVVIAEAMQQSLTQLKGHAWNEIESLSTNGNINTDKLFEKALQDLEHVSILNSMLQSTKPIQNDKSDTKKCEDSVEYRRISTFFQNNSDRFLRRNPTYKFDLDDYLIKIQEITNNKCELKKEFINYLILPISNYFFVKIIFSLDDQLLFVVVHGISENEKSPFEQSEFRIFRTLAVYFSRVLPDFLLKYHSRGLIEFIIWLKSYENLYHSPCSKCELFIDRDLTGDLLPPIIRTVSNCTSYHIKCAPFEIELPDFGYVTLMSEEQMQERVSHINK